MMMGMDEAIGFFTDVAMILDDNDVQADKDFADKYTQAMNRIRYERDKSRGSQVKKIKKMNGSGHIEKCGNCGSECINGNYNYRYCPNCGYAVKRH